MIAGKREKKKQTKKELKNKITSLSMQLKEKFDNFGKIILELLLWVSVWELVVKVLESVKWNNITCYLIMFVVFGTLTFFFNS